MQYLVCKKQEGTGCDYTIGCGMTYEFIEAESIGHATDLVLYPEDDEGSPIGINGLFEVFILPACDIVIIDIEGELEKHRKHIAERIKVNARSKDEIEFERLKEKLGK